MFDLILARLVHSTRPPRDRHATVGNSLLDASATMAKVEVELHPAVAVAIGLVAFPSIVASNPSAAWGMVHEAANKYKKEYWKGKISGPKMFLGKKCSV